MLRLLTQALYRAVGILCLVVAPGFGQEYLIEAESFREAGGWVVDPHSMQKMGSSYLMAHGYGVPVADAWTTLNVTESGTYTVWARTRDWTAVWHRGTPAGQFQVQVDDTLLPEHLGTNGEEWSWQKAGTVSLGTGKTKIILRDLTGFNGRCDAIYLTTDANLVPTNDAKVLSAWREKLTGTAPVNYAGKVDLVVVGGGVAGVCTAVAASRTGCEVVLLQDRDIVGGCNSSEVRVSMGGLIHTAPYPALGNVVEEIAPMDGSGGTYSKEYYEDDRKAIILKRPGSHCTLLTGEHVFALETNPENPKQITAVLSRNTRSGHVTRFQAALFCDATGDATLARMLGCETMYGRESRDRFNEPSAPETGDRQVMGHSVLWYARPAEEPVPFPDIDWAIPFTDETAYFIHGGDWEQEAGQYRDMADETEYIRDYGLLSIFSNWSFLKNHSSRQAEFAKDRLDWVSPVGGKRESYRVVGDYILTQNDIESHVATPDATAATSWNIDIHFPDPENVERFGEPFRSCAYHRGFGEPYPVPYRCLYARDVDNLFLAGRDISASHAAFASVRVMRTLGMLGEVVGMAASICKKEKSTPRDVYESHFDQLKELMIHGVPKTPTYHTGTAPDDWEAYHFKELGFIMISPNPTPNLNRELIARIKKLGMVHRQEHPQLQEEVYLDQDVVVTDERVFDSRHLLAGARSVTIGKGGTLQCGPGTNLFGTYAGGQGNLVPSVTIDGGTLHGASQSHSNLGGVVLIDGVIASEGVGSDELGNFCMAGQITGRGHSIVTAARLSFRNDGAVLPGHGILATPEAGDELTIGSELTFYAADSGTLTKTGAGTLVLSGKVICPITLVLREGTLRLEGPAQDLVSTSEKEWTSTGNEIRVELKPKAN